MSQQLPLPVATLARGPQPTHSLLCLLPSFLISLFYESGSSVPFCRAPPSLMAVWVELHSDLYQLSSPLWLICSSYFLCHFLSKAVEASPPPCLRSVHPTHVQGRACGQRHCGSSHSRISVCGAHRSGQNTSLQTQSPCRKCRGMQ